MQEIMSSQQNFENLEASETHQYEQITLKGKDPFTHPRFRRASRPRAESSTASKTISILIINPNSSGSMTSALKPLLIDLIQPHLTLDFYTAPSNAPPSIDDDMTSALSSQITFPTLLPYLDSSYDHDSDLHHQYSAYLVACYSPHPLTPLLRAQTSAPVMNIFEASLIHARVLDLPFGIVTTGEYWQAVLTDGVKRYFVEEDDVIEHGGNGGAEYISGSNVRIRKFLGVRTTELTAGELHSTPPENVDWRIADASADLVRRGAQVIILGCAGMSGMERAVRRGARGEGKEVRIIDGVRAGVTLLEGLVRAQAT